MSESVAVIRVVKGIIKVCHLMERCDGHGGGVKECGEM